MAVDACDGGRFMQLVAFTCSCVPAEAGLVERKDSNGWPRWVDALVKALFRCSYLDEWDTGSVGVRGSSPLSSTGIKQAKHLGFH